MPITTSEKKSSAIARVRRKNLTSGLIRFPRSESAPTASATSVGMETAQAGEFGFRAIKIIAGRSIPPSAQIPGKIASLGFSSPCRISSPIRRKKIKVRMCESMSKL